MRMHCIILTAALLVASQLTFGQSSVVDIGPEKDQFLMSGASILDGKEYRIEVNAGDLSNSPAWNPVEKDVPLSPHDAYCLAEKEVVKMTGLNGWTVYTITLHKDIYGSNVWWYEIPFGLRRRGALTVVVLLDGKVIMPRGVEK